jgi:hypothetical protein
MPAQPVMPFAPGVETVKADGKPFDENDREFWERADRPFEYNGEKRLTGLREHRYMPYPKMLYKSVNERMERDSFQRQIVQSERHHQDLVASDPAWKEQKTEARAFLTAQREDEARHAAEAAYKAERMSEPAKRAYHKRSAESTAHAQE